MDTRNGRPFYGWKRFVRRRDETASGRAARRGHGRATIAALLGMSEETVREWLCTYRSAGIEVLTMMGKKHTAYSFETKLAAVRAVVDEGMTKPEAMEKFGIASPSPFKKWLKAYREEGPEALRPKPRGGRGGPAPRPGDDARARARAQDQEARGGERLPKKIDRPEGGETLSNGEKAAVVSGLSGQYPSPTCSSAPAWRGRATTTRCRTRRLPPGPSSGRPPPRYSRAPPTGAATGRSPCACAPSRACA